MQMTPNAPQLHVMVARLDPSGGQFLTTPAPPFQAAGAPKTRQLHIMAELEWYQSGHQSQAMWDG